MSDLPPATLPAYRQPPPPPPGPDPNEVEPVVRVLGYLGLLMFDVGAWLGLAALVPALGWVALSALVLLLTPFAALVLFEIAELVVNVLAFVAERLTRGRRDGLVLASA